MSLRVALGCHPALGEDDAHLRTVAHALACVGADAAPLIDPEQWPDAPPDVLHYAGAFHVETAVKLVAHAQRLRVPFYLTCRYHGANPDQEGDLWQRGTLAATIAAKMLFAPESIADEVRASLDRDDTLALPEMRDQRLLESADVGAFRSHFDIDGSYLLILGDRLEEQQQQHLLLAAAALAEVPAVVLARPGADHYRARCDLQARDGTVYATHLPDALRGGAIAGAAAVLVAPRHRDHATHVLTALAAGSPVVAGPGTALPDHVRPRVAVADPASPAGFAEAILGALEASAECSGIDVGHTAEELGCTLLRGYGAIPSPTGGA